MNDAPAWLSERAEIAGLLAQFIDRLDKQPASERQRPVAITLSEKYLPALFHQGVAADRMWDLIQSLQQDYGVIHITLAKKLDDFAPEYAQARITLQDGGEETLRDWLQRPRGLSPLQQWRKVVEEKRRQFPGNTEKLAAHRINVPGKEDAAVIAAFSQLGQYTDDNLSLRQLSSRCFWGDSKFLDAREELIRALYPDLVVRVRPVMVSIFIPEFSDGIEGILFIENQDSYTNAINGNPEVCKSLILVYAAGFKGSATRIRNPDGVSLHYHSMADNRALEDWWFKRQTCDWPVWFWGDLDYAGMGILKALKQRFPEVGAWPPGYEPMFRLLQQQRGHQPGMADKQAQKDPGTTGCSFADKKLLPVLRQIQEFIDQEVVFDEPVKGA